LETAGQFWANIDKAQPAKVRTLLRLITGSIWDLHPIDHGSALAARLCRPNGMMPCSEEMAKALAPEECSTHPNAGAQ